MKFKNPLLVVKDIEKSKEFYKKVLGLDVIMDFGANVTLTGGIALQSEETWKNFINKDIKFNGNDTEIYFEEDNFDDFLKKLNSIEDINYVHIVKEHSWGQRVIRLYDLDNHIIEVGENMEVVCRRFLDSGMTTEQVARRMDVPLEYVIKCKQ